jgi:hypothetical protein
MRSPPSTPVSVPSPALAAKLAAGLTGRDTRARAAARAALVDVLWSKDGQRRLPRERELVAAIEACDARDLWWVCEANSAGPLYLLPTREWIEVLARTVDALGVKRVLEVAAGDGFLSACLQRARPKLTVIATDSGAWASASRRQSARDKRELRGVPFAGIRMGAHVERAAVTTAVKCHRPDLVLVSWAPPGTLVERAIRGPCRFVLDVSVDGDVCGNGMRTWRFQKELLDGPIEERALCRLDTRPRRLDARHTRVTLYYGARHREYGVDRAWMR